MTFSPSAISEKKNVNRQYLEEALAEPVTLTFADRYKILWSAMILPLLLLALLRVFATAFNTADRAASSFLYSLPVVIAETALELLLIALTIASALQMRNRFRDEIKRGGEIISEAAKGESLGATIGHFAIAFAALLLVITSAIMVITMADSNTPVFSYAFFAVIYCANPMLFYNSPVFADEYYLIHRWTIRYAAIARIESPESEHKRIDKLNESYGLWFYNAEGKLIGRDRFYADDAAFLRRKIQSLEAQRGEVTQ
ncbi:MAG: hypothetical protein LBN97_09945 [Oscillospiraceae bacterium]|nr:hypothetical protein [Oscillospiraceae bacterium]